MRASLRIDAHIYSGMVLQIAGITLLIVTPVLLLLLVLGGPDLALILVLVLLVAIQVLLVGYAWYLRRAEWLGVEVLDGLVHARYVSCLRVREAIVRGGCRVVRVGRGDPLWPAARVCGAELTAAFGLFRARNGTRYYALIDGRCDTGLYIEADGLKLFICTDVRRVETFIKAIEETCRVGKMGEKLLP
ncbi:hypothetical protein Pyrfu_0515 [Pyrolobus fumarii 1A]|uniref:Uncharacterized protein n=1 Tax=Pyrolobus fumarii (strain DSM 11204 / 1A) TaxID=694429 RepID=G0EGL2_PYRF1|nr:hypothetical protein [Pyrolobus fumarii]AEM38386.1 hypothetical protein Pyrfu_0515 [Pyrolobus fumarii 1A]